MILIAALLMASAPTASDAEQSTFGGQRYTLTVAGTWSQVESKDPSITVYRRADGKARISVSVATSETPIPEAEIDKVAQGLEEVRRGVATAKGCAVSASRTGNREGTRLISYTALCPSDHRLGDFVILRSALMATLLYEAQDVSESEFEAAFQDVVRGFGVVTPPPS